MTNKRQEEINNHIEALFIENMERLEETSVERLDEFNKRAQEISESLSEQIKRDFKDEWVSDYEPTINNFDKDPFEDGLT